MNKIFNNKTAKVGFSVIALTALLLVILILVNLLTGILPKNATLLDLSENKMYSISDASKRDISKIKEDVDIYLLTAGGEKALTETGIHLDTFLKRLSARNNKLSYDIVDLYTDTAFLTERGIDSSTVTDLSIVIESERRYRYIDSADIFYYYIDQIGKVSQYEAQLYQAYYGLVPTYRFAGESLVINALSFVTSADVPTVISLTGHGETPLPSPMKNEITTLGASYSEITTLSVVPGCELLIINAPTNDISENEASLLSQYLSKGGKLMITTSPEIAPLTNLTAILDSYGLGYENGIVVDPTQGSYYQYTNWLIPSSKAHTATAGIASSILLPNSHAITISDTAGVSASALFVTSSASYLVPIEATSAQKPEGAEERAYTVGAIAEATNGSAIIWVSSSSVFDETANKYVSGGNYAYMSAITSYMCDIKADNNPVDSLTLSTETLTFSALSLAMIALLIVVIIPLSIIIIGAIYCRRRKSK